MMGSADAQGQGLIPRICKEMFDRMKCGLKSGTGYKTHVSYLEIYNERVQDLLGSSSSGHGLKVREHRTLGPYVENLSQHPVANYDEIKVNKPTHIGCACALSVVTDGILIDFVGLHRSREYTTNYSQHKYE